MTIHLAYRQLLTQLYEVYDNREAANIADLVIEHLTGQKKIDRILYKDMPLTDQQQELLEQMKRELLQARPVQYVIGEAWFMNMKIRVNESVLIPRPETEELVGWIVTDIKQSDSTAVSLIDIGTGSGCIPIAVRKQVPTAAVSGIDVSDPALQVAILNSIQQNVLVDFLHLNFLNEEEWNQLGKYSIIVSNPPYVKWSEKATMAQHVVLYEPATALFVPDEDPLIFYTAIAKFATQHLKMGGAVYVEINETLGQQVANVFRRQGFVDVSIKKDLQGKERMVKAAAYPN